MVELKKKVTLKTKTGSTSSLQNDRNIQSGGESHKSGAGKWIVIIVIILVVVGLVYYFTQRDGCDSTHDIQNSALVADSAKSEKIDSTTATSDDNTSSEVGTSADGADTYVDSNETKVVHTAGEKSERNADMLHVSTVAGGVDELACEVIRGNYGNGMVRKQKLGDRYAEVQARVNEIYHKGLVN